MLRIRRSVSLLSRLAAGRRYLVAAVCTLGLGISGSGADAQLINQQTAERNDPAELRPHYLERLVQIRLTVRWKNPTSGRLEEKSSLATGFLVSENGYVVTARHVFDDVFNPPDENTKLDLDLSRWTSQGPVSLYLDGWQSLLPKAGSGNADIAIFKVLDQTNAGLPHLCLEHSSLNPTDLLSDDLTIATFFFSNAHWKPEIWFDGKLLGEGLGADGVPERWRVNKRFHDSMSGGAIIADGRVIGVISAVLEQGGRAVEGHNYFTPLQFADVDLEARSPQCKADHGAIAWHGPLLQHDFMTSTLEGTIAWVPQGPGSDHWAAKRPGGNFLIRKGDLSCDPAWCNCEQGEKDIWFVLNHYREEGAVCEFPLTERTFYGVQVVPRFSSLSRSYVTLMYRNADLFRPGADGRLVLQSSGLKRKEVSGARPSDFNAFHELATPRELAEFDRVLAEGWPWHGFPRSDNDPKSTFELRAEFRGNWRVPEPQMRETDGMQVNNWILRYRGTDKPQSDYPVDLHLCVNDDWASFYIRAFSPERCVSPYTVQVFLE